MNFTENNRKISIELFQQQLNNSLSNATNLYWDFVALRQQVRVAKQSVAVSQKRYEDNQKHLAVGALACLDLSQSESELGVSRRDLRVAQTNLQMQEARSKVANSKAISNDLDEVQIEPVDPLPQANEIEIPSLNPSLVIALAIRSVIRQNEIQLENQSASQAFTHKNLLPTLSVFAQFNSYTLAARTTTMFRQMAQWVYPENSVGSSLTFAILNRAAQADDVRSRLDLLQAQISLGRTRCQVGLGVRTAVVGLIQSRVQIEAAQRAVASSQQSLRGQQMRLQNGLATPYSVILAQRYLVSAQSAEIQARVSAAKALVALQVSIATFLESHGISFDDALRGELCGLYSRNLSSHDDGGRTTA